MSSQRGNVSKKGHQKHQNSYAFKNNLHDTTNNIKILNGLEISGVCRRCKDIIEWKIRYRKYKPLPQAKKCVRCLEKAVKNTYYVICVACATREGACAKCGEKKPVVLPQLTAEEKAEVDRMVQVEIENMSERKRRPFLRLTFSQQVSQIKKKLEHEGDISSGRSDSNVDGGDISSGRSDSNVDGGDIGDDCHDGSDIAGGFSDIHVDSTDNTNDCSDSIDRDDDELNIKTTDNKDVLS